MVYSSTAFRMSRKVRCQEQRKESAQMMKGCLGDSWEGGSSGEIQSGLDAHFVTLSLSISMKRKVIACSGGCEALMDSRTSLILGPRISDVPVSTRASQPPEQAITFLFMEMLRDSGKSRHQGHSESPQSCPLPDCLLTSPLSLAFFSFALDTAPFLTSSNAVLEYTMIFCTLTQIGLPS